MSCQRCRDGLVRVLSFDGENTEVDICPCQHERKPADVPYLRIVTSPLNDTERDIVERVLAQFVNWAIAYPNDDERIRNIVRDELWGFVERLRKQVAR